MENINEINELTERLRQAHVKTLRDRYNALIDKAKQNKEKGEQSYEEGARQAYVDMRLKSRDMPARLAAMGLSGGINETLAAALMSGYEKQLDELANKRATTLGDADAEMNRRRTARDNAINEYLLRNNLTDAKNALSDEDESDSDLSDDPNENEVEYEDVGEIDLDEFLDDYERSQLAQKHKVSNKNSAGSKATSYKRYE